MTSTGIQERIVAPRGVGRPRPLRGADAGQSRPRPEIPARRPEADLGLTLGGLTKDGLIQERMRWPVRGTALMRTVASRVINHAPSHYAMLGVSREFTEAQLRKQYRLLALRFHPDAAARNGIDEQEATERFRAMQTAYEVLSDPSKRRKYDLETRLKYRQEWRRCAWGGSAPRT